MTEIELIEKFCLKDSLATNDPYDVWFVGPGFWIKKFYNFNKLFALPLAALITICDQTNIFSWLYPRKEYPIVRALASMALLNLYKRHANEVYLQYARKHLMWLLENKGECSSGAGWGIPRSWSVSKGTIYPPTMTLSTVTPYCLEAFYDYQKTSGSSEFSDIYEKFKQYFTHDIKIMFENADELCYSYSHEIDREVINANSYTLFSQALLSKILNDQALANNARKIYNFIRRTQRSDGAWYYTYNDQNSFIDCFHSCFVLKNLIKASAYIDMPGVEIVINKGWSYIKDSMFDKKHGLFVRFSKNNKANTTKFDLYDNAEALNIAFMLHDFQMQKTLLQSIEKTFMSGDDLYSKITFMNFKYGKNHLRWAVMPYLYTLSKII